jgi:EmrB/QacA subfamily drug resistance transporter
MRGDLEAPAGGATTQRKQWPVLAVASAANFLTILDLWAVSIAYPAFERAFAPAKLSEVSWILNVYAILLAALLVPAGRLADGAGRKACFLAGLSLFGAASLGCALAPSLAALVAFRALQGAAAAMLMPTSLGFALSAFPERERGTAVGVWAAVGAVAASGGPVVGGLLVTLSWRWIFLVNVPLVAAAVAAGVRHLPRSAPAAKRRRIDALGALLVSASMALVCTALIEAGAWRPWRTWSALGLGVLLAAALVAHVLRHPDPVVAPRLFAARRFRIGAAGIFAYYVGYAAMLLGLTLLLTDCWHLSVLQAALAIAPGPIVAGGVALLSGRLVRRFGLRRMVLAGAVLFAGAAAWPLASAGAAPAYAGVVLPSLVLWGVANALIQPTLFATADAAPKGELASGSAVLTMARQLGSAFGVALLVAALGAQHAADLPGLRRAWALVIAAAALIALAGLRAERRQPASARAQASASGRAAAAARAG